MLTSKRTSGQDHTETRGVRAAVRLSLGVSGVSTPPRGYSGCPHSDLSFQGQPLNKVSGDVGKVSVYSKGQVCFVQRDKDVISYLLLKTKTRRFPKRGAPSCNATTEHCRRRGALGAPTSPLKVWDLQKCAYEALRLLVVLSILCLWPKPPVLW